MSFSLDDASLVPPVSFATGAALQQRTAPMPGVSADLSRPAPGRCEWSEAGDVRSAEDEDGMRLQFAPLPQAVPQARHLVQHAVTRRGWDELMEPVALLFTELAANAIQHSTSAGGETPVPVVVTVRFDHRSITVEVHNAGPAAEPIAAPAQPPTADAENGRGLFLVEALAADWGSRSHADGTVIWFTIDRHCQ
ncbi:ATP-binding protein [Streptomyces sp. NPDC014861]|uniref:ATP-binding protein n=1 Tax=Streptomyces sp. NPDC014861 TaxID=3364923 RepID=UPI0036FD1059